MVRRMNKHGFIKELSEKINYDVQKCEVINNILEDNFFLSSSNREKIKKELSLQLGVDENEASHIYEEAKNIIEEELKRKFKHPFKSRD